MAVLQPLDWLTLLYTWLIDRCTRFTLAVLASGPIPKHIAFVMDGNRRYARLEGKPIGEGHADGFLSLQRVLECCLRLGVRCVSVYAFSIENFKRSEEEVDALMTLLRVKMLEISQKGELLDQYGVRLNVIGQTALLSPDVQDVVRQVECMTAKNEQALLNVCMPYTSRDEMATAIRSVIASYKDGDLSPDDITDREVDSRLGSSLCGSPPLDILVRTSGVNRLSDFMLWQCCETTQIQYIPIYWPDFGLRHLVPILLDFQLKAWSRGRVQPFELSTETRAS